MPTEVSLIYIEKIQSWYETASSIEWFAWAELNGEFVAGSKTNPQPYAVPQTGDLMTDVQQAIINIMQGLTGDLCGAYNYPGAVFSPNVSTDTVPYGNVWHNIPFVAVAYSNIYQFGSLNIPARDPGESLQWKFAVLAEANSEESSPAYNKVVEYFTANEKFPVLLVIELNAQ